MNQILVAALIAYSIATGKPLPLDTPKWDGNNIATYMTMKDYFK